MHLAIRRQSQLKARSDRSMSRFGCDCYEPALRQPKPSNGWYLVAILFCLALAKPARLAGQEVQALGRWPSEQLRTEAQEHARVLWGKILSHCGDSYYYAG